MKRLRHKKFALLLAAAQCVLQMVVAQQTQKKPSCIIAKSIKKAPLKNNMEKNVLGTALELASVDPITGFYRTGYCSTGANDAGSHVVAAVVTEEFLNYSKKMGNDLITPNAAYGFVGLKPGNVWCLCAKRWKEALGAGVAPPVILKATNSKALHFVTLEELKNNAVD
jgi:uncharacterized protein